jgi:TRAP-type C4-dicarboxylate transport system permease small subunit
VSDAGARAMPEPPAAARGPIARFRAGYGRALEWVVIVLVVTLAVEVTLGVAFRALGHSLAWYDEVASVLLAWLTFYGAALASVRRAHIGCPELVDIMPWPARRAFNITAELIVIAFFALLGTVGAWILPVLHTDALVSLPWIPMSVVQSVIPISAVLIIVAELTHLADLLVAQGPVPPGSGAATSEQLH